MVISINFMNAKNKMRLEFCLCTMADRTPCAQDLHPSSLRPSSWNTRPQRNVASAAFSPVVVPVPDRGQSCDSITDSLNDSPWYKQILQTPLFGDKLNQFSLGKIEDSKNTAIISRFFAFTLSHNLTRTTPASLSF